MGFTYLAINHAAIKSSALTVINKLMRLSHKTLEILMRFVRCVTSDNSWLLQQYYQESFRAQQETQIN